ncbi:prepilin peptidase [Nonomuraea sp. SBT364]|uniref:prepilin peptidase n=1 Tax=Nonomuraea sp. SBT364 TaxID=1580530 RepID=UPI00069E4921|nr:A24 family peptidase [Nonomuraea sp. SBT364]
MLALLGVLGLVAGRYVRTLAGAFGPDPADHRADHRAGARAALRALVRTVPVPAWPPIPEVATAAVTVLVAWRAGLPYVYAAVAGTALAVIDWRTSRLPDVITLPSYPILALALLPTGELPRALLGGLALAAAYGVLWFARPADLGLGDVKLAGLIGLACGALGWQAWTVAALGGQFLGALYAAALLVTRRATRTTQFPFGPFMLLGGLAGLCLGG